MGRWVRQGNERCSLVSQQPGRGGLLRDWGRTMQIFVSRWGKERVIGVEESGISRHLVLRKGGGGGQRDSLSTDLCCPETPCFFSSFHGGAWRRGECNCLMRLFLFAGRCFSRELIFKRRRSPQRATGVFVAPSWQAGRQRPGEIRDD